MDTNRELSLLNAISSSEPSSYNEFLRGLDGDVPDDKPGWRQMFDDLRDLETNGLVDIERLGGKIDTLQLTEAGVARVKELRKSKR